MFQFKLTYVLLLLMQECLCALVIDDSEEVSAGAQESLRNLFTLIGENQLGHDVAQIFTRFVLHLILDKILGVVGPALSKGKNSYKNLIMLPGSLISFQKWCLGVRNHLHYHTLSSYL